MRATICVAQKMARLLGGCEILLCAVPRGAAKQSYRPRATAAAVKSAIASENCDKSQRKC